MNLGDFMKLVRISSSWCVSCIVMNKIWRELQEKYPEYEYIEYDYDIDDVSEYNVGNILPVIIIYKDNKEIKRIIGEKTKQEILEEEEDLLKI